MNSNICKKAVRTTNWLKPRVLVVIVLITAFALLLVVRASEVRRIERATGATKVHNHSGPMTPQAAKGRRSALFVHPAAVQMMRRLGQRYLVPGKERTLMSGILSVGSSHQPISITRTQTDNGEQVQIQLGGGQSSFAWDAESGASVSGRAAAGTDRQLIERLVFDSPDQFVFSQLRNCSYYPVAQQVRPEEAGDSDDYNGPVWDVVRVGEPNEGAQNRPVSPWRLYFINPTTQLIERIVSKEQGVDVTADVSGWANRGGEVTPGHIVWKRNGQVIMELELAGITHGPQP